MKITDKDILNILKADQHPLKAKQVASILRKRIGHEVTKTDVNRLLYLMKDRGAVQVNGAYCWSITRDNQHSSKEGKSRTKGRKKTSTLITHYDILQVSSNALPKVIEKAYKVLATIYHPDCAPKDKKKEYEELMKRINIAYAVLSDIHKRKEYDEEIGID